MLISFLRTIILYLLLIASIRLMGKRQLGEMEPTEFVVTMLVANLHNPNNKAYQADADNRANQMNPNHRSHQRTHNANRRNKAHWMPEWAPDYPEYDD